MEAEGHVWGQMATLPLVPLVVDAFAPAPVVATGGVADGRGLAAVLALGTAGVWMGTRFVASQEAEVHLLRTLCVRGGASFQWKEGKHEV